MSTVYKAKYGPSLRKELKDVGQYSRQINFGRDWGETSSLLHAPKSQCLAFLAYRRVHTPPRPVRLWHPRMVGIFSVQVYGVYL